MTKFALALLGTAAALATPIAAQAQRAPAAVVVVVDTGRVSSTCTACVAATTALRAKDTAFQQRRTTLLTPLQTEEQSLAQAVEAAQRQTGAARATAEAGLKPRIDAFNTRRQTAATELQRLQEDFELTRLNVAQQLEAKLGPIYTQVMNTKGANIMVPTGTTLARGANIDVTNDVLALLNQQAPSFNVVPLPRPAQPAQPTGR